MVQLSLLRPYDILDNSGTTNSNPAPDSGYVLLLDADGSFLTDPDGSYLQDLI